MTKREMQQAVETGDAVVVSAIESRGVRRVSVLDVDGHLYSCMVGTSTDPFWPRWVEESIDPSV